VLRRYLAKRLVVAIPSLLIASLIVFTLPRLIPGDVVSLMLEEKAYARDLGHFAAWLKRPCASATTEELELYLATFDNGRPLSVPGIRH